jgi:hypothetical protein
LIDWCYINLSSFLTIYLTGFCSETETIGPGLLAEATTSIIKDELTKTLVREGVSERDARTILEGMFYHS